MSLEETAQQIATLLEKYSELQQEVKDPLGDVISGQRDAIGVTSEVPSGYSKVTEGAASVLAVVNPDGSQEAFYNPAQVVNRDLSIIAIRGYDEMRKESPHKKGRSKDEGLRILEGLSATGLRAVRYWKEIPNISKIIVNDLLPSAVAAIKRNLEYNGVPQSKVIPNCDDAVSLMQRLGQQSRSSLFRTTPGVDGITKLLSSEKMDVVDLDPYGTAAPFLDSAITCAEEGGLMCITCTDCDVLCGVHPEACHHKYGAMSVRAKYCHEMAVRILLGCVERHAARHGKFIKPLLSLQIDFYVRVFVRIETSRAESKLSIGKLGHLLQCSGCAAFRVKPIGTVRVEERSRTERNREKQTKKQKRKRSNKDPEGENEVKVAKADAEAEVEAESPSSPTEPVSAAMSSVPCRKEPRLKYGTATSVKFCSSYKPATAGCNICNSSVWVGGPIWTGPTHDKDYVSRLIAIADAEKENFAAYKRVRALLAAARDELPDCPMFYQLAALSGTVHCSTIPMAKMNSALMNLGYRTSQVHCCPDGIKTDAPPEVVYDVMKAWTKELGCDTHPNNAIGHAKDILASPQRVNVDFTICEGSDMRAKVTGETKWGKVYVPNWGPKPRAKGNKTAEETEES